MMKFKPIDGTDKELDMEIGDIAKMIAGYHFCTIVKELLDCGVYANSVFVIHIPKTTDEVFLGLMDEDTYNNLDYYSCSYNTFYDILCQAEKMYSEKYPGKREEYEHLFPSLMDKLKKYNF